MPQNGLLRWRSHTDYERLCAKLAYGDASDLEFVSLIEHLRECAHCRVLLVEFTHTMANVVPQIAEGWSRTSERDLTNKNQSSVPKQEAGIGAQQRRSWRPVLVGIAILTVLCIGLGTVYLGFHKAAHTNNPSVVISQPAYPNGPKADNGSVRVAETFPNELRAAYTRINSLESSLRAANRTVADDEKERTRLTARLDAADKAVSEAQRSAQEQSTLTANLEHQIADRDRVISQKEGELTAATARLTESSDRSARQRETITALAKVQELIASRDLHLISVAPIEPRTERTPAFGRILYAEGRELMFYGYDLAPSGELANVTFHIWGEKIGAKDSTTSLGVFKSDDRGDNRWRFTFGDAAVLSRIDRIFVTAERPAEVVTKPKGKRILVAYLGGPPNHP